MRVPDILKKVFERYNLAVEYKLTQSYREWEYCVQYQESDFNFVSRLMEHEGMYYWFRHEKDKQILVITDEAALHVPFPNYKQFLYVDTQTNVATDQEIISQWVHRAEVTPSQYSVVDYDFRKPDDPLDQTSFDLLKGDNESVQVYEWHGGYQEIEHAEQYAKLRIQELKVPQETIFAKSTIRGVAPGSRFTLVNYPRYSENKEYVVTQASYDMAVAGYTSGTDRKARYDTVFTAIPATVQYRAPRVTPQPKTQGPQTAKVVGPAGHEVCTDKYGRIKVQFYWDREGKNDENSSCWIRVSSPWAGSGFGGLQLPRIGDEVVIDFIGGQPDRPMVIGRVYNESNMPPVNLPYEANISGFRTQSVFGDSSTENHLLFHDKLGQELVELRAQFDHMVEVMHNLTTNVKNDSMHTVDNNSTSLVGNNNFHAVKQDNTNYTGGDHTENTVKKLVIGAGELIRIECGQCVIELNASGEIKLAGKRLNITVSEDGEISTGTVLNLNPLKKGQPAIPPGEKHQAAIQQVIDQVFPSTTS